VLGDRLFADLYTQHPDITVVNPQHFLGDPVYYVNGMATDRSRAVGDAELISGQLHRPVYLIYNPMQNSGEIFYDRTGASRGRAPQIDPVTRQVTYVLYHAALEGKKVSIISHSQGSLITHNAVMATADALGQGGWVGRDLAWVSLGTPFNVRTELGPRPAKFVSLVHGADWAGRYVGMNGTPQGNVVFSVRDHHLYTYVPELSVTMVW